MSTEPDGLKKDLTRKRYLWAGLRAQWEMGNFCCSHRCTSDVRLGQGRARVSSTGASRCLNCQSSFDSCDRPYPSSVSPCISAPFPRHPGTKGEQTSRLRTVSAGLEQVSLASNDEECQFQCLISLLLGSSKKSSSEYSSAPLDLSSRKCDAADMAGTPALATVENNSVST
jgi:hypothetical protein